MATPARFRPPTIVTWLSTKIGKRRAFFISTGLSMVGYALKWFCYQPEMPLLLLIPLACSLFGISLDVAMQVVAVGFVISVIQDSAETALNSSTDVVYTYAVDQLKLD